MSAESDKSAKLKHELRTPLNHIIGYCEMLLEEAEDRDEKVLMADLEKIHAAGRRLLNVIHDVFAPDKASRITEAVLHHEVRTPLNQIIGFAEILQEEAAHRGQARMVADIQKIHEAARHLLRLVVEDLMPARFTPGGQVPNTESSATTFMRREEIPSDQPQRSQEVPEIPGQKGQLLVVDDDRSNRDMLARRLRRLGYEVVEAENGREALEVVGSRPFDLVLLDILMPELNGYQVLEQLKSDPALAALPVIVISASDETENVAACIEMGAEDYLSKPFDPVILQARISASLEKKRFRDREVSYLRQIEEEKKRSDDLLHVILPADVAAELKATHEVKPRRFNQVGVLFCDIVGFTAYCEQHPPEQILQPLQRLVESFERLTLEHRLEKIKTIGDAFMATAGLLSPLPNPALHCVRCALAMIAAAKTLPPHWDVRIGLDVGPVIAGVVGHRKYQYDVWGDTVNTAARMEEAARPGSICVTHATWLKIQSFSRGTFQGRLQIKGKGELELFRIEGLLD